MFVYVCMCMCEHICGVCVCVCMCYVRGHVEMYAWDYSGSVIQQFRGVQLHTVMQD